MNPQILIQERLKQKLVEAKAKNPRTSVRSFARQIKIPASTVSLVLLGKRKVSKELALKISDVLQFDPMERAKIVSGFEQEQKSRNKVLKAGAISPHDRNKQIEESFKPETLRLSEEKFDLLSEWYYFGILSLVQTEDFKTDAEWIAARLGLDVEIAKTAFERLITMGMITVDPSNGKATRTYKMVRTADGKKNASLRRANQQNLELAKKNLEEGIFENCDFTWINLPVDLRQIEQMKVMIRSFQSDFINTFGLAHGANEVLRVCVQAFPVSTRKGMK